MNHHSKKNVHTVFLVCLAVFLGSGCDRGGPPPVEKIPVTEVPPVEEDHGEELSLGRLELANHAFEIVTLGEVVAGTESALEVLGVDISPSDFSRLNLYLWLEDDKGVQLSPSSKGSINGNRSHFHVTPRTGKGDPHRVVLRVRTDGLDERGKLPLDGHGHLRNEGLHHGVVASFSGDQGKTGHLELKLHDDKGDLELWLANDKAIKEPFDLPLETVIEIEFIDFDNRKVALEPRNRVQNEDEDGLPNIRDGKTQYFIYPTSEGQDASWLMGKEFSSIVLLRFNSGGEAFVSEEFVLKPHSH